MTVMSIRLTLKPHTNVKVNKIIGSNSFQTFNNRPTEQLSLKKNKTHKVNNTFTLAFWLGALSKPQHGEIENRGQQCPK